MKIVFVVDNYMQQSNGTTITTYRFIEALKQRGHEIRILSTGSGITGLYSLEERKIPIVSRVAKKQDVIFSKPNKKVIEKALEGADLVHLVTPWKTSRIAKKIADKLNIATTASFHIPPEAITYGAGLSKLKFLNSLLYRSLRRFYSKISYLHAPSNHIAKELKNHHFPSTIKVISNGVLDSFYNVESNTDSKLFTIISTGRYAIDKNQILLLKAVSESKYKNKIKVILPGQGPLESNLKDFAKKHKLNVEFGFLNQKDLIKNLSKSSLYVHTANVEIEGISCIEAIAAGVIPLISDAKKSATSQFALTDKNLYKANNVLDLTNKIDFFIENKDELNSLKSQYKEFSEKFRISNSINLFEGMLQDAVKEQKSYILTKSVKAKAFNDALVHGPVRKTITAMTYYLIALPILYLYMKIVLNVKVVNRKHFRSVKGGAVVISNHVHMLDSVMNSFAAFPKRPIIISNKNNFKLPVAGIFVNILGAVPVPDNILETHVFFNQMSKKAKSGRFIHIYPEAELVDKDTELRQFKRGAFKLAVLSSVPIVPVRISFIDTKFLIWDRKSIVLNVGEPLYPDFSISSSKALDKLMDQSIVKMDELNIV